MKKALEKIKPFLFSLEGVIFIGLVLAAIAIRIPLMTYTGYYADLVTYIRWGETVTQHFTSIYTTLPITSGAGGHSFPGGFPGGGFPGGPGGNGGFPHGRTGGFLNNFINYPPAIPYLVGAMV